MQYLFIRSMHEGETIKQPQDRIEELERENELLKAKISELEARLAQYENAHTPPSLRRGRNRKKDPDKNNKGKPGQNIGHKGVTRPYAAPDRQVEVTIELCPDCGADLGVPFRIDWIWTFSTPSESFFVIRKSRGMKVLTEVLTRKFKGIIVCDGWKPYARFTNRIQRCWAHLLRESKEIAEKFEEAIPLHNMLKELYEILTEALENDPPPKVRKNLWKLARKVLRQWIRKEYSIEKVRKFIGKINNGFDYWFTFIINPGVEPTNNRAERALRPHVVLRKILGTLRNDKGTSIHERIMTTLATWGQRGLNSLQMLTEKLAS